MHLFAYVIFSLFAAFLAVLRIYITGTTDLLGLLWNLILAVLPYIFALGYISVKNKIRWLLLVCWFFFLPNSFYIISDFVHLPRFPEMVYYDIIYISTMAFAGMISWFASLELVHREWNIHYHKRLAWFLVIATILISTTWVYIGRFLRFNSWDILHDPLNLIREIWLLIISNGQLFNISNPSRLVENKLFTIGTIGLIEFVALYGAFFLLVYAFLYHSKKR